MTIELKHDLGKTESIDRIKRILTNLKKNYGNLISDDHETWKDDLANIACKINGYNFNGTIQCFEHKIKLNFKIPLLANIFKPKIKSEIEKYAKAHL
jgi:hypothetical protein